MCRMGREICCRFRRGDQKMRGDAWSCLGERNPVRPPTNVCVLPLTASSRCKQLNSRSGRPRTITRNEEALFGLSEWVKRKHNFTSFHPLEALNLNVDAKRNPCWPESLDWTVRTKTFSATTTVPWSFTVNPTQPHRRTSARHPIKTGPWSVLHCEDSGYSHQSSSDGANGDWKCWKLMRK